MKELNKDSCEINIFDTETIVENCNITLCINSETGEQEVHWAEGNGDCTVQIWSNSITGNRSVGWWRNKTDA